MYHGIHSTSFFCGFDTDSSRVRYFGGGFLAHLSISPLVFHPWYFTLVSILFLGPPLPVFDSLLSNELGRTIVDLCRVE